MSRTYGVYIVSFPGKFRWLRVALGHFIRHHDISSTSIPKVTKEHSNDLASRINPLVKRLTNSLESALKALNDELDAEEWTYHYLVTVPLGIDEPLVHEVGRLTRLVTDTLRPGFKHILMPAYMAEKGAIHLGTNITHLKKSIYYVQLHGRVGKDVLNPPTLSGDDLKDLIDALMKQGFVSPAEYGVPGYGAVIIVKKIMRTIERMEVAIKDFVNEEIKELAFIAKEFTREVGGHPYDVFNYTYHCLMAEAVHELINRGVMPPISIPAGLIEVFPRNVIKVLEK